ncbi:hypothetical protein IV203_012782 [Nitzschia inconspicua]|uniref:Uncharacterized protein n=1 Tax=Nitzschia inconspicua TaxID=303405 RepID=A0A9K3PKH0_9STRA|nr:hypothetical protein IV203_012768 [Nitzschia inconspicua]KAG7350051.1 hypothetical protein IV203_012648 [Nitzschia inconspicua]KAG7373687.1 hypothetical protein IV203_012782 [Nitzschia inconspicua]
MNRGTEEEELLTAQQKQASWHRKNPAAFFPVYDDEGKDDRDYLVTIERVLPQSARVASVLRDRPFEVRAEDRSDDKVGVHSKAKVGERNSPGFRFAWIETEHRDTAQQAFSSNLQTNESIHSQQTHSQIWPILGQEGISNNIHYHHSFRKTQVNDCHWPHDPPTTKEAHNAIPSTILSRESLTSSQSAAQPAMESSFCWRPLYRRPKTRSQSITIKKRSHHSSSWNTPTAEDSSSVPHDSYNERLYDSATWRMYHRIVDHRRSQLQRRQQEDVLGGVSVDPSSPRPNVRRRHDPAETIDMMVISSLHKHPFNSCNGPSIGSSSTSSLSSSSRHSDQDEIFEMEL